MKPLFEEGRNIEIVKLSLEVFQEQGKVQDVGVVLQGTGGDPDRH